MSRVCISVTLWWMKLRLGRFVSGFLLFSPAMNFIPPFLHTHLIHFVSFHFISPFDGVIGMIDQHPCNSQTFNVVASSQLIPRPGSVSDMSCGDNLACFAYLFYKIRSSYFVTNRLTKICFMLVRSSVAILFRVLVLL